MGIAFSSSQQQADKEGMKQGRGLRHKEEGKGGKEKVNKIRQSTG